MKAILMLKEMPKSCKDCILCTDNWWCVADDEPTDDKKRPTWCPLKPLPQKKTIDIAKWNDYGSGWDNGYNACIDEILGEEK